MRISAMIFLMSMALIGGASAATINFNDGRAVTGDIVKKDEKSLQVMLDGVPMTYYADEIKDIDGKPFAAPAVTPDVAEPSTSQTQSAPTSSGIEQNKRALILKFIDVFGTRQALTNNFELMTKQIEKEKPDEAQKIRQRVKVDEIIERLLPIYDRNFTADDLKAFIVFYQSPKGQKLIITIPELMKESIQESVKYMEEKFPEINQGQ